MQMIQSQVSFFPVIIFKVIKNNDFTIQNDIYILFFFQLRKIGWKTLKKRGMEESGEEMREDAKKMKMEGIEEEQVDETKEEDSANNTTVPLVLNLIICLFYFFYY